MPETVPLSGSECQLPPRAGLVGGIAVNAASGPPVVPVDDADVDGAGVVRIAADQVLGAMPEGAFVPVEVDQEYQHGRGTMAHWRRATPARRSR